MITCKIGNYFSTLIQKTKAKKEKRKSDKEKKQSDTTETPSSISIALERANSCPSLIFQSIRVIIVLLGVLALWFLFYNLSNKRVYIYADIVPSEAEIIEINNGKSPSLAIEFDQCEFETTHISIDKLSGQTITLNNLKKIEIVDDEGIADEAKGNSLLRIEITPIDSDGYFIFSPTDVEKNQIMHFNLSQMHCTKMRLYKSMLTLDGIGRCTISGHQSATIIIKNCVVKVNSYRDGIVKLNYIDSKIISNGELVQINLQTDDDFECNFSQYTGMQFDQVNEFTSEMIYVRNISLLGDGNIAVSYTADPKEYKIRKQPISFSSKNYELSLNIYPKSTNGQESYSITTYGFVNEVSLAGLSLMPSMSNWLRENIYILPASFATVIIGSIKLIELCKNKEKANDNKSKETDSKKEKGDRQNA